MLQKNIKFSDIYKESPLLLYKLTDYCMKTNNDQRFTNSKKSVIMGIS